MHLSFQKIHRVNDREARNGWVPGVCLAKKDQISGISGLKLTLCRDRNTANLVLLPNDCHGQRLSGYLMIGITGYVHQMNFYANKNHNEVKVAGA
jgi:hypothetical protein